MSFVLIIFTVVAVTILILKTLFRTEPRETMRGVDYKTEPREK